MSATVRFGLAVIRQFLSGAPSRLTWLTDSNAQGTANAKLRSMVALRGKTGPKRPLTDMPRATLQLHENGHSCIAQHIPSTSGGSADLPAVLGT